MSDEFETVVSTEVGVVEFDGAAEVAEGEGESGDCLWAGEVVEGCELGVRLYIAISTPTQTTWH